MSKEARWLIDTVTSGVIKLIAEDSNLSAADALRAFCSSSTYKALTDPETGLYLRGPAYVHELYLRACNCDGE